MESSTQDWFSEISKYIAENTDHRTKNWPLISNPYYLMVATIAYLNIIYIYGPKYMQDRKPYSLKAVITVYNVVQIFTCVYLFYEILMSGWLDEYSLGCQPVDRSLNPKAYKMARLVWWTLIVKITELIETVFFVLRKKENQISRLHVYHHVSTMWIAWLCCRFTPGGMGTFSILVNSFIHIIMYTYYLIALHGGKELQKKLHNWKKAITVAQMVQFTMILVHSLSSLRSDCNFPSFMTFIFMPNITILYYMFFKFYKKSYNKNK